MTIRTDGVSAAITTPAQPGRTLLVARESGSGTEAKILLEQLFRTLVRDLDGREVELPDFGDVLEIYDDPTLADTEEFTEPNMRAVLIKGGKADVLLSLGSARKLNSRGENSFIQTLIRVLDGGGYESVMTTTLSRICRNRLAASDLEKVLVRNRVKLLAAGSEIKVWEQMGSMMWMLLTWFATVEAEQIEARLTAAKLTQAAGGKWSFGFPPPPGWRRRFDGRVEVDESGAEAVRWVIRQVLSGRSDWNQMASEAFRRWPDLPRRKGEGSAADLQAPGAFLRRALLNPLWYQAYTTNRHEIRMVSDVVKRQLEWARERGIQDHLEPDAIASVVFELPPPEVPVATEAEIEALAERLSALDAAQAPRRRRGAVLLSAMSWPTVGVEMSDAIAELAGDPDKWNAA